MVYYIINLFLSFEDLGMNSSIYDYILYVKPNIDDELEDRDSDSDKTPTNPSPRDDGDRTPNAEDMNNAAEMKGILNIIERLLKSDSPEKSEKKTILPLSKEDKNYLKDIEEEYDEYFEENGNNKRVVLNEIKKDVKKELNGLYLTRLVGVTEALEKK